MSSTKRTTLITDKTGALQHLLGTQALIVGALGKTEVAVPARGQDAESAGSPAAALLACRARLPTGCISALDLWALRNGLRTRIGPAVTVDKVRGIVRAQKGTSALRQAAVQFLDELPYSTTKHAEVPIEWVEAELLAAKLCDVLDRLPSLTHIRPLNAAAVIRARVSELWATDHGKGKRPVLRMFVGACKAAGLLRFEDAAIVLELEAGTEGTHVFEHAQRARGTSRRSGQPFNPGRHHELLRKAWASKNSSRQGVPAVHVPRDWVTLRPVRDCAPIRRAARVTRDLRLQVTGEGRVLLRSGVDAEAAVAARTNLAIHVEEVFPGIFMVPGHDAARPVFIARSAEAAEAYARHSPTGAPTPGDDGDSR